jgi:hypothetical protein
MRTIEVFPEKQNFYLLGFDLYSQGASLEYTKHHNFSLKQGLYGIHETVLGVSSGTL